MSDEVLLELQSIKKMLIDHKYGDDELWDSDQIANYLGLTKDYCQRTIMKSPKFPDPFILEGSKTIRWKACEVKGYAVNKRAGTVN